MDDEAGMAEVKVNFVDISLSSSYGSPGAGDRPGKSKLFWPTFAERSSVFSRFETYRRIIIPIQWHLQKRHRFLKRWEALIQDADLIVIGGGQLLMDTILDFHCGSLGW